MSVSNPTGSLTRRGLLGLGLSAAVGSFGRSPRAFAQHGPVHRLIVGFPPGGFADRLARLVAEALGRASSSNFIVENRPGAGGMIAAESVGRAEGNERVLLLANVDSLALERALKTDQEFDPLRNLTIVAGVARFAYVMVAHPKLELRSLQDLIATARRSTEGLSYVDFGAGSRVTFEFLREKFLLNLLRVPYRGVAPAMVDFLSGRVDLTLLDGGTAIPYASSGKLTILGRVDGIRSTEMSRIPTLTEQGADGLTIDTRFALVAPARASPAVVETFRELMAGVLKDAAFRAQLRDGAFHAIDDPPAQFIQAVADSAKHYRQLAQQAGLI